MLRSHLLRLVVLVWLTALSCGLAVAQDAPAEGQVPAGEQPELLGQGVDDEPVPEDETWWNVPPRRGFPPDGGTVAISLEPDGMVTVNAVSADAGRLFTKLGEETRTPIIVDDSVARRVTINLIRRSVDDVIAVICTAYALSAKEIDGIWVVTDGLPQTSASYLLSEIGFINAQNVKASNAVLLLPRFLRQYAQSNDEQNSVVISAPQDILTKIEESISSFDIPSPQIAAEILVVELTDTGARELGLGMHFTSPRDEASLDTFLGEITYSTVGELPEEFGARIRALVTEGKARVRANPKVVTVNGRAAMVFVGRVVYLIDQISGDGGRRNYIDAGVQLILTPWTGGGGEIILEVSPSISTLSARDRKTNLPEISTREASTTVRVKDGDTVIIGGLLQREQRRTANRVPLLGDLPLIGWVFRSSVVSETDTELVIFITPRILTEGQGTQDEQIKEEMLQKVGGGEQ